jgi:DNA-binding NarL/FixJ family response regulator
MNLSVGKSTRIAIIEDETLFAKALGAWLANDPSIKIEGYAKNGSLGWELCQATLPDLVLVDVEMTGGDGLTLAKRLLEKLPATRVIIMTGRVDPHTAWKAGQIGVHGLIDKTIEPKLLGKVIQLVAEGGGFLSPAFHRIKEEWLTAPEAFQKVLTNRELLVLNLLTEGWDDVAIGKHLDITIETVACHRKSLRKKLELHDDRSLMAYGREWGIFGLSDESFAPGTGSLPASDFNIHDRPHGQ